MLADVPVGLFLTHHLRRAFVLGPCLLAAGILIVATGGSFAGVVLGRLLMGVGHALSMMSGLTALLRFATAFKLASALSAFQLSAIPRLLAPTLLLPLLPPTLASTPPFPP